MVNIKKVDDEFFFSLQGIFDRELESFTAEQLMFFIKLGNFYVSFEDLINAIIGELDKKYPHQCYGCKKELEFRELILNNNEINIDHLKKLWMSKCVKFYCCKCLNEEIKKKELEDHLRVERVFSVEHTKNIYTSIKLEDVIDNHKFGDGYIMSFMNEEDVIDKENFTDEWNICKRGNNL